MQIRRNADGLKFGGLVWSSSGNNGERRFEFFDDLKLFLAQLERDKPKNSNTPGHCSQLCLRFLQKLMNLGRSHQSQCQKRQPSAIGNRFAKWSHIADSSHGALHDGIRGAVRLRQWRIRSQCLMLPSGAYVFRHALIQCRDSSPDRAKSLSKGLRKRNVLPQRE